jgi:hypothetical protein
MPPFRTKLTLTAKRLAERIAIVCGVPYDRVVDSLERSKAGDADGPTQYRAWLRWLSRPREGGHAL